MPVRILNFVKEPPKPRTRGNNRIQRTEEWQDLVLALGGDLKPQEYITVSFPPEHSIYKELREPTGSLMTQVKRKVKELGLPYDVYLREKVIYIVGRGVIS